MGNEQTSRQVSEGGGAAASATSTSLPDINAETYPFDTVQHLLDQAAYLNLFSVPDRQSSPVAITSTERSGGVIGIRVSEVLHRFEVDVLPPTLEAGLRATNVRGEAIAKFNHRWIIIPDDFRALPDREPPPTPLDPSRSQRFVMLDGVCTFGGGKDGFRGFGTGITYPGEGNSELLAAAVGDILEGFGKLKGHEGTYTYCGTLSEHRGFTGNLLCRIMDPEGDLRTDGSLPALEAWPDPDPGITYIVLHGRKKDKNQKTTYRFGADGQVNGLNVTQQLRLLNVDSTTKGRGGLKGVKTLGPIIGNMTARIMFNLLNPGAPGTALAPIPFQSYNEYTFFDREGRPLGSFGADGGEGRTFTMKLAGAPGQAALRFGGFGPIVNGTGRFAGIQGLMTDNSVVGIAPHALSTFYVLRIRDPEGKYRAAFREAPNRCERDMERLVDAARN